MFEMLPYDEQLCSMANSCKMDLDACRQSVELEDMSMANFHIIHRILILSSFLGVLKSVFVCVQHYCVPVIKLSTLWHVDRFLVLPPDVTRKIRCIFSFIDLNVWLLMSYASISFKPSLLLPWLIYNYILLGIRLAKFGLQAAGNNLRGQRLRTIFVLLGMLVQIAFVTFCKSELEEVLDMLET